MLTSFLLSVLSNTLIVSAFHFWPRRKMYGIHLGVELRFLKHGLIVGLVLSSFVFLSLCFEILAVSESVLMALGLIALWGFIQLPPPQLRPLQIASALLVFTALDMAYPPVAGAKFVIVGLLCFLAPFIFLFAFYQNRRQARKSQQNAKDYEDRRRQRANEAFEDIKKRWSSVGQLIEHEDLKQKFELHRKIQFLKNGYPYNLRVIEGDLTIEGDLNLESEDVPYSHGLLVTGNLTVSGCILNTSSDTGAFLLCLGNLKAFALTGGGSEIVIEGNATVDEIVIGHYNDGILGFRKDLHCPLVVSLDHDLTIQGKLYGIKVDSSTCEGPIWQGRLADEIPIPNDPDESRPDARFDWKKELLPRLQQGLKVRK
jgi:hypothetical protein